MTPDDTHYCDWDTPGKNLVRAICGAMMRRLDHVAAPTCPRCQRELARRAAQDAAADRNGGIA